MAKQKVWIVTTGNYSDYTVQAVCSTKGKAELVAKICRDANKPFALELDAVVSKAEQGKKLYLVWCFRESADVEPIQFDPTWETTGPMESQGREMLRLHVWAKDELAAAKIAGEKRAAWIAGSLEIDLHAK